MNKMVHDKKNPSTSKGGDKKSKNHGEGSRGNVEFHNEQEGFFQNFQKPTVIYRWMAVRQRVSPVFLTRNLAYMQNKESKPKRRRANFDLSKLAEIVKPKPVTVDNVPSFITLTYIKNSEVAELFAPNSSCMMNVVVSKVSLSFRLLYYPSLPNTFLLSCFQATDFLGLQPKMLRHQSSLIWFLFLS